MRSILFFLIAANVFGFVATARGEEGDVLATLRKGHPRLFLLDDGAARIKQLIIADKTAGEWFKQIQSAGDALLSEPPAKRVLIGPRLLGVSRQVLSRTSMLGLLYRLTGEKKYAERCRDEMIAAAKFSDWNPSHFLDVAEMTNALAIGYDWVFGTLTSDEREAIRAAIVEKGLKPGLKVYASKSGWHTRTNNWNQVCNGGLTVGALAVADEEGDIAGQIIEHGRRSIPLAMKQFAPDGGCIEGPGYWAYATRYTVFYLAALKSALDTDFGFLKTAGFAETGMFRIQTTGPLIQTFNFADAGDNVGGAAQMLWLAATFNKPIYAEHERQIMLTKPRELDPFHLVWFNRDSDPKDLPTSAVFRGVEVVTMRSGWTDPSAGFVGFKGGDNAASHANLDLGDFVYDADGVRWAIDLGPDDYNLAGYFGKERWSYYRLRTEGQNTLTIDGENQKLVGKAPIVEFSGKEHHAVADLSDGYPQAKRVRRGVTLLGKRLLVQDEVEAEKPVEVVWNLHTSAKIARHGLEAVLTQGNKQVTVSIQSPADAVFEIADADPIPQPWPKEPAKGKLARYQTKLIVRLTNVTNLRLDVMFTPQSETPTEPAVADH